MDGGLEMVRILCELSGLWHVATAGKMSERLHNTARRSESCKKPTYVYRAL